MLRLIASPLRTRLAAALILGGATLALAARLGEPDASRDDARPMDASGAAERDSPTPVRAATIAWSWPAAESPSASAVDSLPVASPLGDAPDVAAPQIDDTFSGIRGAVTDAATGEPVDEARVIVFRSLEDPNDDTTSAWRAMHIIVSSLSHLRVWPEVESHAAGVDADGRFGVELPAGRWWVVAGSGRHVAQEQEVRIDPDGPDVDLSIQLEPGAVVLEGRVLGPSGEPEADAVVRTTGVCYPDCDTSPRFAHDGLSWTAADGSFRIAFPRPPLALSIRVESADGQRVGHYGRRRAPPREAPIEVRSLAAGTLRGVAVGPEGEPLVGAMVCAGWWFRPPRRGHGSRFTLTGEDGRYEIGKLPSDVEIKVSAHVNRRRSELIAPRVTVGPLGSRRAFEHDIAFTVRIWLRGRVVDDATGQPLAGVDISVGGDGGSNTTSGRENGEFSVAVPDGPGHYTITAGTHIDRSPVPLASEEIWMTTGDTPPEIELRVTLPAESDLRREPDERP